jgi:hypothetical protein
MLRTLGLGVATSVLSAACGLAEPDPAAKTAAESPPEGAASADLDAIVRSAPPPGMSHDGTLRSTAALTQVVISGRAQEFEALDGFVDGRAASFSGDEGAFLSIALAFETADNAAAAFSEFEYELESSEGYDFGASQPAGLGDEGVCDVGPNPALDGLFESICIWQQGRLVLIAGGPIDMAQLHDLAEGMEARAH